MKITAFHLALILAALFAAHLPAQSWCAAQNNNVYDCGGLSQGDPYDGNNRLAYFSLGNTLEEYGDCDGYIEIGESYRWCSASNNPIVFPGPPGTLTFPNPNCSTVASTQQPSTQWTGLLIFSTTLRNPPQALGNVTCDPCQGSGQYSYVPTDAYVSVAKEQSTGIYRSDAIAIPNLSSLIGVNIYHQVILGESTAMCFFVSKCIWLQIA